MYGNQGGNAVRPMNSGPAYGGPAGGNPMSWSGNSANMNVGLDPATWLKKKHPNMANDFMTQVGLTKTDPNLQNQIMAHGQAGMKPPQQPMGLQQLMQMVLAGGGNQRPQQAPQGLMQMPAMPQRKQASGGLWG